MWHQVFCGNVQADTTEGELRELFDKCGTIVRASVMQGTEGEGGLGYGFVEFATREEAEKAIKNNLQVPPSPPRPPPPPPRPLRLWSVLI